MDRSHSSTIEVLPLFQLGEGEVVLAIVLALELWIESTGQACKVT